MPPSTVRISNPHSRMLMVLEHLNRSRQQPMRQIDIARECGLSPATLNRMIAELSEWGYVLRTTDNRVICNFRFERNVRMTEHYQGVLAELIENITAQHGIVAEVIVNAGNDLLWQLSTNRDDGEVHIRARPGFRRGMNELDVLSRLYLARLDDAALKARFESVNFSTTGVDMRLLSETEVREILDRTRPLAVDHDFTANRAGIRRFATWVPDSDSQFVHLLALAEPALPVADPEATIARRIAILEEARTKLMEEIARDPSEGAAVALR